MTGALRDRVGDELERIEEDCEHSSKSQFNASDRWSRYHVLIGLPAVVLAATASAAFLKDVPMAASIISMIVAILTSAQTFLKPGERGKAHKSAGDQYLALKNAARIYRNIGLLQDDELKFAARLNEFDDQRKALNTSSPIPANRDFNKARKGISQGETRHAVDKRH